MIENNKTILHISHQVIEDADVLIIKTAINLSYKNVASISEDADVLVTLAAFTPSEKEIFY